MERNPIDEPMTEDEYRLSLDALNALLETGRGRRWNEDSLYAPKIRRMTNEDMNDVIRARVIE